MNKEQWEQLSYDERAWRLNLIISHMNDEEAYYSGWLYIWPDGETREDCKYDFEDEDSYKDLEESFILHYSEKESHKAGLYSCRGVPESIVEDAHFWDEVLGLEPIQIIK